MTKIVGEIPGAELIDIVRNVGLLKNPEIKPYANAEITFKEVEITKIRPTTLYVLRSHLQLQRDLAKLLAENNHDPLQLEGGLLLEKEDKTTIGLIPPLLEVDAEHGPLFVDGAHRLTVGLEAGKKVVKALHIEGAHPDYPVYAYPNEWSEITVHDEVPTDPKMKKRYREGDYSSLYRNFSAINGSTMRTV